jgi:hypothetical protein
MKATGEQLDERIVEVHWDSAGENWRMMRFRDDKPHGNHRSTVENIIQSIADGVERDVVRALLYLIATLVTDISSSDPTFYFQSPVPTDGAFSCLLCFFQPRL